MPEWRNEEEEEKPHLARMECGERRKRPLSPYTDGRTSERANAFISIKVEGGEDGRLAAAAADEKRRGGKNGARREMSRQ